MTQDEFRRSLEKYLPLDRRGNPDFALRSLISTEARFGMKLEDWLTWVLRPHRDAAPPDVDKANTGADITEDELVAQLRRSLDDALDALTCVEIELQCGPQEDAVVDLPDELRQPLCVLAQSEAFLRYLDTYRFFGIRFLMGRDAAIRAAWRQARNASNDLPWQFNRPILPLATPPSLCLPSESLTGVSAVVGKLCKRVGAEEQQALLFLDGFYQKLTSETGDAKAEPVEMRDKEASAAGIPHREETWSMEPDVQNLELWMRGMLPEAGEDSPLLVIATGLRVWATKRARVYTQLGERWADPYGLLNKEGQAWKNFRCDTPLAARVALLDLYWLGGLLRAEVTPSGEVTYERSSWLSLLRFRETLDSGFKPQYMGTDVEWPLERVEAVLRAAFCAACELVQNAAYLEAASNRQDTGEDPAPRWTEGTKDWRDVFDDELIEIAQQRKLRSFQPMKREGKEPPAETKVTPSIKHPGWSRRLFEMGQPLETGQPLQTGQPLETGHPRYLAGLAFSGGGIRSATFNLGVLQGLQELDLLRQVDFLSTVSGGGFIGSWLLGNVKRTRFWLTRQTSWDQSIKLLRNYSNYLAPRTGFFSLDTWSLATLWLRNTLLIQISILSFLLMLLTVPYLLRMVAVTAVGRLVEVDFWHLKRAGAWIVVGAYATALPVMLVIVLSLLWPDARLAEWRAKVARGEPWYRRSLGWPFGIGKTMGWLRAGVLLFPLGFVNRMKTPWPVRLWKGIISPMSIRWLTAVPAWASAVIVSARLYGLTIKSGRFPAFGDNANIVRPAPTVPDTILGQVYVTRPEDGMVHRLSLHSQVYETIEEWCRAVTPHATGAMHAAGRIELPTHFANILRDALRMWHAVLYAGFGAFLILLLVSLWVGMRQLGRSLSIWSWIGRVVLAVFSAALCTAVLHLCFSTILYVYLRLHLAWPSAQAGIHNLAFLAGPSLVLLSYSAALLLLIGLSGKYCTESQREWWTRFGSYMVAVALVGLLLCGFAFGSPWIIHRLLAGHHSKFALPTALVGWVGTTIGGLVAGKSRKTSGEPATRSVSLDLLAQVGGFLFLVGAAVGASELLYQFFHAFLDDGTYPYVSESIAAFNSHTIPAFHWWTPPATFGVLLVLSQLFSWFFEINIFGLNQLYRNRLVRCYLGATRWMPGMRSPEPFTSFDFNDDIKLSSFRTARARDANARTKVAGNMPEEESAEIEAQKREPPAFRGPFPIVNCTLNLAGSGDLSLHTRHSASFTMTPLFCGADRDKVRYRDSRKFAGGVRLGQAVAISGAAASPNMGYNTSPLVAFLLTVFNVRLGWWIPNPSRKSADRLRLSWSLWYLLRELVGLADESQRFLNLSDGGHFENLGIYELVRRNCTVIIAGDAECDDEMAFGGLANAIRLCATDFGAIIDIDLSAIRRQPEGQSHAHASVGTIRYSNGSIGHLIYLKSSLTGDEDPTITQYRDAHPTFPHESTADQFFSEDQFESYRRLGQHVVRASFRGTLPGEHLVSVTQKMADMSAPPLISTACFLRQSRQLNKLWDRLREQALTVPAGTSFLSELMGNGAGPAVPIALSDDVTSIGLQMIQLMEDVFVDLKLDDGWEHADHRGWAMLFLNWARSPRFRQIWKTSHRTFGIRFEYFCASRLGLAGDHPVVRV